MVAGVHLAIASKVFRPGCTACMKMNQQHMRRWRPRHTVGMPRKTMVTKPGREVKAISMCRALSGGGIEQKAADGSSHVAFTPFAIDFQAVYGLGCQFCVYSLGIPTHSIVEYETALKSDQFLVMA